MKLTNIPINELNPSLYNPRKNLQPEDKEYQDILKAISEFGLVIPLIVNEKKFIIGGHQRYKILKHLGHKEIPCIIVNLSLTKEKMLNIALNKIRGDWDMPKLKDLLEELDTGEFDLGITGFDQDEVEKLMTQFHVDPEIEENIQEYKRIHILISIEVDYYIDIAEELESIKNKILGRGEYEESAN